MKRKTILIVSQVLSDRHTKQASKNVADTTFKYFNGTGIVAFLQVPFAAFGAG